MNNKKIAVISSGNGGQSMAAYFAYLGYKVTLYAREAERVDMFPDNRFVLSGEVFGEARRFRRRSERWRARRQSHLAGFACFVFVS